jgi:hypothetical protein
MPILAPSPNHSIAQYSTKITPATAGDWASGGACADGAALSGRRKSRSSNFPAGRSWQRSLPELSCIQVHAVILLVDAERSSFRPRLSPSRGGFFGVASDYARQKASPGYRFVTARGLMIAKISRAPCPDYCPHRACNPLWTHPWSISGFVEIAVLGLLDFLCVRP